MISSSNGSPKDAHWPKLHNLLALTIFCNFSVVWAWKCNFCHRFQILKWPKTNFNATFLTFLSNVRLDVRRHVYWVNIMMIDLNFLPIIETSPTSKYDSLPIHHLFDEIWQKSVNITTWNILVKGRMLDQLIWRFYQFTVTRQIWNAMNKINSVR